MWGTVFRSVASPANKPAAVDLVVDGSLRFPSLMPPRILDRHGLDLLLPSKDLLDQFFLCDLTLVV